MPEPEYDAVTDPDQSYGRGHAWVAAGGEPETDVHAGLRIERIAGRWSAGGRTGHWFRLSDAGSGALLLDTREIPNAELRWLEDGRLLVKARLEQREAAFRIDPGNGSFRNLGTGDPPRPLEELAAAVDAHLRQVNDGEAIPGNNWDHRERVFSPDARFRLDRSVGEDGWGRPRSAVSVALTDSNETVFEPSYEWQHFGSDFDEGKVRLKLSRVGTSLFVSISPLEGTGRIEAEGEPVLPLFALPGRMNDFAYGRPPPEAVQGDRI